MKIFEVANHADQSIDLGDRRIIVLMSRCQDQQAIYIDVNFVVGSDVSFVRRVGAGGRIFERLQKCTDFFCVVVAAWTKFSS